ncbi:hypothetical protein HaLaN_08608 [Haematococcus lacustris]|uniref:Uncharacterized protein n=1 Tax=Haematococcus lacustris TaxID=44745 RepID=A0A699Z0Q6_HAELA|nr:hypothetical protein HaLaN_08608 [Haematococcus lacustris]
MVTGDSRCGSGPASATTSTAHHAHHGHAPRCRWSLRVALALASEVGIPPERVVAGATPAGQTQTPPPPSATAHHCDNKA